MKKIAVVLCGMEYSNQQELVQGMIQYQSEHGGKYPCVSLQWGPSADRRL